jgi:hypothetical protein
MQLNEKKVNFRPIYPPDKSRFSIVSPLLSDLHCYLTSQ